MRTPSIIDMQEVRVWPAVFQAIRSGEKTRMVVKSQTVQPGELRFVEYSPYATPSHAKGLSGRTYVVRVDEAQREQNGNTLLRFVPVPIR